MKIILNLFLFLLIGCSTSNQKKDQIFRKNEDYLIQDVLIETRDGAKYLRKR